MITSGLACMGALLGVGPLNAVDVGVAPQHLGLPLGHGIEATAALQFFPMFERVGVEILE